MSLVFENAVTIRYQIQEMARVEKLTTDAQILGELKVYNPLIPDPGELSATLFIELTDKHRCVSGCRSSSGSRPRCS